MIKALRRDTGVFWPQSAKIFVHCMMSIANEQQFAMDQLVETNDDSEKYVFSVFCKIHVSVLLLIVHFSAAVAIVFRKPRITYTRKFLISLSEKDVCKKLPNLPGEFDEALLL